MTPQTDVALKASRDDLAAAARRVIALNATCAGIIAGQCTRPPVVAIEAVAAEQTRRWNDLAVAARRLDEELLALRPGDAGGAVHRLPDASDGGFHIIRKEATAVAAASAATYS